MSSKEDIEKLVNARKIVTNRDKECMVEGCTEKAINSHIIQKSQFIEPLANGKNELYYLETLKLYPGQQPSFKRETTPNILSFPGFCQLHDQMIFQPIEKNPFNLSKREHLLLFSYRAICLEMRKKMDIIEWFEILYHDLEIDSEKKPGLHANITGNRIGLRDMIIIKKSIESDITKGTSLFEFKTSILPRREIVTSVLFDIEDVEIQQMEMERNPGWAFQRYKMAIMTVFPDNKNTNLIIGYLKEDEMEMDEFIAKSGNVDLDFVNKIILERAETWAVSETLFKSMVEPIKERLLSVYYSFPNVTQHLTSDINILK